jgi:hypothetical protein
MSFYLYDEALVDRLRKITGDDRIHIVHPDQSVSFLAQFDKDKVQFPVIVVTRAPSATINPPNQVAVLKGQSVRINEDNTASKIKLIPMRLEWSIDVYAVDRYTCDEIVRELIFYFTTYPRFQVKVPYDLDVPQNFDVLLGTEVVDNTDLTEFPNTGELFRETISVYTENAHLYASKRQYLTKVKSDVDTN